MEEYYPEIIHALAKQFKTTPETIVCCLNNRGMFPCFYFEIRLEYNYLERDRKPVK